MQRGITPQEALQSAVIAAGSQSEIGRICGVGQPSVWKWLNHGKLLPAEHVLKVEAATGVSRHDLRPDLYPLEPAGHSLPTGRALGGGAPSVSCDRSPLLHAEQAE